MGKRGEGGFAVQLVLFALILLAARVAPWAFPAWLRAIGGLILVAGGLFGTLGLLALGSNLSPFPKPITGGELGKDAVEPRMSSARPEKDFRRDAMLT